MDQELEKNYKSLICKIIKNNHRGIVVLSGENYFHILSDLINYYISKIENYREDIKILYVTEDYFGDYLYRYEKLLENFKDLQVDKIRYKDSDKILGKTYNILILDMYKSLTPDYLGRIIETLSGSGIGFLIIKDFDNFEGITTTFHEHLLTPPYKIEEVRKLFEYRFKNKLMQYENILIYDIDKGVIKGIEYDCDINNITLPGRDKLVLNENKIFSDRIYRLCYTQDQANVLSMLENLLKDEKAIYLIIADRGRGKSASIGLSISALVSTLLEKKEIFDIGITAPSFNNVETLFNFLKIGLKKEGIDFKEIKKTKIIVNNKIFIEYRDPREILSKKYDYLFVDEAAGIGIELLYRFIKKYKQIIFSSTIHGYEGAGRSFSVRFMKFLNSNSDFKLYRYTMIEPIRYNKNDPIEKWLYDSLLLDSEPDEIDKEDIDLIKSYKVRFYRIPLKDWFYNDDKKLKNFVGIYILAHYQNRPNDIAMLADAPHHDAFVLELENDKIVNGVQIAYEGGIEDEVIDRMLKDYKPKGNIIPDIIVKHYRIKEFAKLKGLRVIRIATIPEIQGYGLGSISLEELSKWSEKNRYDWIGSSFGVTYELLNFWQKNKFLLVHLSPEKNKVSGEYSGIVLRPLNENTEKIVKKLNYEFRWKLINQVSDVYFDLTPKIILKMLETHYKFKPHFHVNLTDNQIDRLRGYIDSPMTYEAAADVAKLIYIYYLLYTDEKPRLNNEEILVGKFLLSWSFGKISDYFNIGRFEARRSIKKDIKIIYKWLFK
ncbi:tRNA(Met) cytidine acetyltransferase [Nanobdella aerobiophila]|uniref:tRNA(Met) cytidine acetyltransferase TmcA n=1 Tax=Nanobdella aerobiophila TaxID=2586965 RepID=A0A915SKX6_9ARCH|nr:GNAT family N-acetyltransferase [Nanobdella aerobiophila]BBL45616.1 tRNA(Met) cytidine acetyltransferase [Nanobdella aerobiophila]